MSDVLLEYNPITRQCRSWFSGRSVAQLDELFSSRGRLQGWASQYLRQLPAVVNDDHIVLKFRGTAADFEDLKACAKELGQAGKLDGCTLQVEAQGGEPVYLDFDEVHGSFRSILEEIRKHPSFAEDVDFLDGIGAMLERNEFRVAVIATMSCGKSTLLSALLGRRILPAKAQATTAALTYIYDSPGVSEPTATVYNRHGEPLKVLHKVKYKDLDGINEPLRGEDDTDSIPENERPFRIDLEVDIPNITSTKLGRLVLIDTPGPNNAGNKNHQRVTYELIKPRTENQRADESADLVLFLMTIKHLWTDSDVELLEDIAARIKEGGIAANDRFVFVLTHVDALALEEDEEETLEDVVQKVKKNLRQRFAIDNPIIVPVDALGALLATRASTGETLKGIQRNHLATHMMACLEDLDINTEATCSQTVKNRLTDRADHQNSDQLYLKSGVALLEEYVSHYLEKYAFPLKLQLVCHKIEERVATEERQEQLDQDVLQRKGEFDAIRKQVQALKRRLDNKGVERELAAELARIRNSPRFRSPRFPAQEAFTKALNTQLHRLERSRSSLPGVVQKIVEELHTALAKAQAKTEAELKDQIGQYAREAYDALERKFLSQLQQILDESELAFELPKVGSMRVGRVSLKSALRDARFHETEEYVTQVKKTRSKWNPKRWFGNKHYYVDEARIRTVERIDYDEFLADARIQIQREKQSLQSEVDHRFQRSLKGVEDWVERVVKDAKTAFEQLATRVDALTEDQAAAGRKLEASQKRQEAYRGILNELDTTIKGPFSC